MNKLIKQIIKFGFVGGTAFLIDFGVFTFLTKVFNVHYLVANACGFTISVVYNYILSILWVFDSDKSRKKSTEATVFVLLSIIGLCINELIMLISVDKLSYNELFSKIIATAVVMVYNFITRKLFLEKRG